MMGRLKSDQSQLFYEFQLGRADQAAGSSAGSACECAGYFGEPADGLNSFCPPI
jgi:hypothetical protein